MPGLNGGGGGGRCGYTKQNSCLSKSSDIVNRQKSHRVTYISTHAASELGYTAG